MALWSELLGVNVIFGVTVKAVDTTQDESAFGNDVAVNLRMVKEHYIMTLFHYNYL